MEALLRSLLPRLFPELRKFIPGYGKSSGAARIASHLDLGQRNRSHSFRVFLSPLQQAFAA